MKIPVITEVPGGSTGSYLKVGNREPVPVLRTGSEPEPPLSIEIDYLVVTP